MTLPGAISESSSKDTAVTGVGAFMPLCVMREPMILTSSMTSCAYTKTNSPSAIATAAATFGTTAP